MQNPPPTGKNVPGQATRGFWTGLEPIGAHATAPQSAHQAWLMTAAQTGCLLAEFLQDFVENLKRPAHLAHVALTMPVIVHRLALA